MVNENVYVYVHDVAEELRSRGPSVKEGVMYDDNINKIHHS